MSGCVDKSIGRDDHSASESRPSSVVCIRLHAPCIHHHECIQDLQKLADHHGSKEEPMDLRRNVEPPSDSHASTSGSPCFHLVIPKVPIETIV